MNREAFSWRSFLAEIISDPQEKQRLANAMGINPVTLTRWVSSPSRASGKEKYPRPQIHSLQQLVASLPEYREKLIPSLLQEFPELSREDFQLPETPPRFIEPLSIPVICYETVLQAISLLAGELRFITVFDHIFNYAIQQLDPERLGLVGSLIVCTAPRPGQKVHSLRELFRIGTRPWNTEREERNIYCGAESLAGQAISTSHHYVIEDAHTYTGWLPLRPLDHGSSIAVCPIQRTGKVAACLSFISTQKRFFTRDRVQLIQKYCHLAVGAFDENQYFPLDQIELRLLPPPEKQEPYLRLFNKRVQELLLQGKAMTRMEASVIVMRQLEEELIQSAALDEAVY
uniref:GAF domain-containing protein n=1 Tax=Thermosporothrix sp. COM3 TaxID=2490863 RepID=A0A455SEU0_9CHLR|nr:hypothetical protein KTC_10170 [Thermosporothrix sp. COM3]